jgi:T5orf172 domain-containing protein
MTMRSSLYLMRATSGIIKIGRSAKPEMRRDQLAYETRDAGLTLVYATEASSNAGNAERKAHRALALNRRLRQAQIAAEQEHGRQLAERYGREVPRRGVALVGHVNAKQRRR